MKIFIVRIRLLIISGLLRIAGIFLKMNRYRMLRRCAIVCAKLLIPVMSACRDASRYIELVDEEGSLYSITTTTNLMLLRKYLERSIVKSQNGTDIDTRKFLYTVKSGCISCNIILALRDGIAFSPIQSSSIHSLILISKLNRPQEESTD